MNTYAYLKVVHSEDGPSDTRVREVVTQLALHRNHENGQCNPGTRRLAHQSTMARNTVRAKLQEAEQLGWIRRHVRKRGGDYGAQTQYELLVPEPKRVSPEVTRLSDSERTCPGVTRLPDPSGSEPGTKRVSSEPKRVKHVPRAGQPSWSRTVGTVREQIEQPTAAGLSTEEHELRSSESEEFDANRIARAAKVVSKPGRNTYHREWITEDPVRRVLWAEGLAVWRMSPESGFDRDELFYDLRKLFDEQPSLREQCEGAWHKARDAEKPRSFRLEAI